MIRLTVKGLAKYMTSSPAAQRRVLRDFKYPRGEEAYAMRLYYRDACERIIAFHRKNHDRAWLRTQAEDFGRLAELTKGSSGTRLRNNGRAMRQYEQHFGDRVFEVLSDLRLEVEFSGVRITATPDLYVRESGKHKAIKLEFSKSTPPPDAVKVVTQCLYEAARRGRVPGLSSSSVLYLDIPRGLEHRGARAGSRMLRDIEAACETISQVWDSIQPPAR
jgi:hypothetical protein